MGSSINHYILCTEMGQNLKILTTFCQQVHLRSGCMLILRIQSFILLRSLSVKTPKIKDSSEHLLLVLIVAQIVCLQCNITFNY